MELEIQSDMEAIRIDPLCEYLRHKPRLTKDLEPSLLLEYRRKEEMSDSLMKGVCSNYIPCPLVIGPVADDELDFVVGSEMPEILPVVARFLAAGGCLEIKNANDAGIAR